MLELLEYADEMGVDYLYENNADHILVKKYGMYIKIYNKGGLISYIKNT